MQLLLTKMPFELADGNNMSSIILANVEKDCCNFEELRNKLLAKLNLQTFIGYKVKNILQNCFSLDNSQLKVLPISRGLDIGNSFTNIPVDLMEEEIFRPLR